MKTKNHLKPALLSKLRPYLSCRFGLAALAVLIAIPAVAFNPDSVASAVGKLWNGLKIETRMAKKKTGNESRKSAAPNKAQDRDKKQVGEAGDLIIERRGHTATPLADGTVLIIGGENESGQVSQTELFRPGSRKFSLAAQAITPRAEHTATRLRDGRILVIGGRSEDRPLDSSEIYDPERGSFSYGPTTTYSHSGHTATLLADGRVLVIGGDQEGTAEIYDPERHSFMPLEGRLNVPRADHSAAQLLNGRILIAGGRGTDGAPLLSGELFDAESMRFSLINTPLHIDRIRPALRVLPDGKVQVIGGDDEITMEMFNSETVRFTAYAHLLDDPDALPAVMRAPTRAALVRSRNAFAVGSSRARIPDDSLGGMFDRVGYSFTELSTGQAVVIGGLNSSGKYLNSALALSSCTQTPAPTVTTDKTDYAPGQTVIITGAGWTPGENVSLVLHREPTTLPDTTLTASQANSTGGFTNSGYTVLPEDLGVTLTLTAIGQTSGCTAQTTFTDAPCVGAANLDHARNGSQASPVSPVNFQNGNLGSSQSHYVEGQSVPYRAVMTDLPVGESITLTLEYDIKHSGKHALDYLTSYDRLQPHTFTSHSTQEVVNPLFGLTGFPLTFTTFPIPAPSSAGSPVAGQPTASFNLLPATERVMTLYGGTITAISYASQGSLAAAASSTSINVTFTPSSDKSVLAWGGHIASRADWGFVGGLPRSAGGISGSPYHMRLISWINNTDPPCLSNLGNQDRSLAADAVVPPPTCGVTGPTSVCSGSTNMFSATTDAVTPT